jgi:perosamine synthetase
LRPWASLAADRGLKLIEDAACAIGSVYRGKPIGDNTHSQLVCFSFHPRKIMSTGDGGMITTGDAAIARELRLLRQHGMSVNDLERHKSKTIVSESYPVLGYNYRLTDVQASIGLAQLRRLGSIIARRREIAARYDAPFPICKGSASSPSRLTAAGTTRPTSFVFRAPPLRKGTASCRSC